MARIRPVQIPDVPKLPQTVERAGPVPAPSAARAPATSAPSRRPPATLLDKALASPFLLFQVDGRPEVDGPDVSADEAIFALTKLYLDVEQIAQTDDSLEVRQGLQAIESHIRLIEYVRKCRASLLID